MYLYYKGILQLANIKWTNPLWLFLKFYRGLGRIKSKMEKDWNQAKFSHKHTYPKYDSYFLFYLNINSVHIWENFEIN